MLFDILTIFPEFFVSPLKVGILRRALVREQVRVRLHDIRAHAVGRHRMTDDRPYGGGEGMVMKPEPLSASVKEAKKGNPEAPVVLLTPRGAVFSQEIARRYSLLPGLILVCGRYEGVDERFTRLCVDEELSLGDYVLTGGELGALVVLDAVTRLLPGVLGCADSPVNDSFSRGLLKHNQFTRPPVFEDMAVPGVLLSGDHAAVARYRFLESVRLTLERRPELLRQVEFSKEEKQVLDREGLLAPITLIRQEGHGCPGS